MHTKHLLRTAQSQKELFPDEHDTHDPKEFNPWLGGHIAGNSGVVGGGLTSHQNDEFSWNEIAEFVTTFVKNVFVFTLDHIGSKSI